MAKGVEFVTKMMAEGKALKRELIPMDGFTLAIHCGGSDWTTALSGNPTLGLACDQIVREGGFVIMDEWGGLPGSEHLLAGHAVTRKVSLEVLDRVDVARAQFLRDTGLPVEATNPYPSNKEGGITTLVEKSTGNIKKAGSAGLQGHFETLYPPPGSRRLSAGSALRRPIRNRYLRSFRGCSHERICHRRRLCLL